jgi:type IV pilus biogenesis protein CpaD/CtpE
MKNAWTIVALGAATLALTACGSADSAGSEAMPDDVEMPANEPLEPIEVEPVVDPAANDIIDDGPVGRPDAVNTESAEEAAANASIKAQELEEAAAAADAAAAAAAGIGDIDE